MTKLEEKIINDTNITLMQTLCNVFDLKIDNEKLFLEVLNNNTIKTIEKLKSQPNSLT